MASARVFSVNIGHPRDTATTPSGTTGIDKRPAEQISISDPDVAKGRSGVEEDVIGDVAHHGGQTQAVYLVAAEELSYWSQELQGQWHADLGGQLSPGAFGENITTTGVEVESWRVGTQLALGGEVVLEVTTPRTPCRTFAERMGVPGWVKKFASRGRCGVYARVLTPGVVRPADEISVLHTPEHSIDISQTFRAVMGDLTAAQRVLQAGVLPPQEHKKLSAMVERRG